MDDDEMEKCTRRRVVLWLSVILGIFLAAGVIVAHAQSKAKDGQECMTFADYGITTRAMVVTGIGLQQRLAVLDQMYSMPDERMRDLAKTVRQAADKSNQSAGDFAGHVFRTCMENGGDIRAILGPAS